jgi:translation initiation factor 1A
MPNLKGGKNYKKMKHAQGAKPELHEIGEGQMIGKVMRLLGDRQAQVYCNDNVERICKIRGKLRKKVWIATGDIVLLSLRVFSSIVEEDDSDDDIAQAAPSSSACSKGDILAKYDPVVYSKLKKVDGVNKKLFGGAYDNITTEEDLFDTEDVYEEKDDEDEDGEGEKRVGKRLPWNRATATTDDNDVDIDAI